MYDPWSNRNNRFNVLIASHALEENELLYYYVLLHGLCIICCNKAKEQKTGVLRNSSGYLYKRLRHSSLSISRYIFLFRRTLAKAYFLPMVVTFKKLKKLKTVDIKPVSQIVSAVLTTCLAFYCMHSFVVKLLYTLNRVYVYILEVLCINSYDQILTSSKYYRLYQVIFQGPPSLVYET